jgi:hypothetical protein
MKGVKTTRAIVAASLAAAFLPGCIAWEIKDEVHAANERMGEIDGVLIRTSHDLETANEGIAKTDALLEEVRASIATTNEQLADVQRRVDQTNTRLDSVLASLGRTDEHLVAVNAVLGETSPKLQTTNDGMERLRILGEVQTSLQHINTALGPLQKAMGSLGSTMSFLGLGGEEGPAPAQASDGAAPAPDAGDAGAAPPATEVRAASNIGGTWILVHPVAGAPSADAPARVLVLLGNGRYLEGDSGKVRASGTWKRAEGSLTLTPEGGGAAGAATAFEVVSVSARSLTVRAGDAFRVYARP